MSVKAKADAIDRFVRTLKSGGLYDDIKAACVMAGWTNLAGALYPFKGAAPTNVSGLFQNADLDPGIGLKGNGSSKYINSNRANNADGQDDNHNAFYLSAPPLIDARHIMGSNAYGVAGANTIFGNLGFLGVANRSNGALVSASGQDAVAGFKGTSRSSAGSFSYRTGGATTAAAQASSAPTSQNIFVFCRNDASTGAQLFTDATLSWYSIGSSTDLAALDSAVSTLMADLRAIDEDGFEPETVNYLRAVEAADGAYLETGVKKAINRFIVGCKKDGIWDAIKASCILCGARTIAGALVPLAGAAPTALGGWVSGDYNRKTGLVGNGSTKYLDSNRLDTADPVDDSHLSVYASTLTSASITGFYISAGPDFPFDIYAPSGACRMRNGSEVSASHLPGVLAHSYSGATLSTVAGGTVTPHAVASRSAAGSVPIFLFRRNNVAGSGFYSDARIAFYSIGSAIQDLALLDARVSTLISQIAAAIP